MIPPAAAEMSLEASHRGPRQHTTSSSNVPNPIVYSNVPFSVPNFNKAVFGTNSQFRACGRPFDDTSCIQISQILSTQCTYGDLFGKSVFSSPQICRIPKVNLRPTQQHTHTITFVLPIQQIQIKVVLQAGSI